MSEYTPVIIALVIIVLIFSVIYFAVSYAFKIYENRQLSEEINRGFHYTIGFNKSLAKDVEFLKDELRPYQSLANKYGCSNGIELENLLIDLQDKLAEKFKETE